MKQLLIIILLPASLICYAQKKVASDSSVSSYGRIYSTDTREDYNNLSDRNRHIVDSILMYAGLPELYNNYLAYENYDMSRGSKVERFWKIEGEQVVILEYLFWKNSKEIGFRLIKRITVK